MIIYLKKLFVFEKYFGITPRFSLALYNIMRNLFGTKKKNYNNIREYEESICGAVEF
jgi:hypothetical protein